MNTNEIQQPAQVGQSELTVGLDAARFRFIEKHKIKCGISDNGYWEASGSDDIGLVSRKTLAQCIDVLMRSDTIGAQHVDAVEKYYNIG